MASSYDTMYPFSSQALEAKKEEEEEAYKENNPKTITFPTYQDNKPIILQAENTQNPIISMQQEMDKDINPDYWEMSKEKGDNLMQILKPNHIPILEEIGGKIKG